MLDYAIMKNDYFQFKQFRIEQSRAAMKVGTDGVLLGAWADMTGEAAASIEAAAPDGATAPLHMLDIGTGTGLLALMLAQRASDGVWGNREFKVTAVEMEPLAAAQARENVAASPWASQIEVVQADIRTWRPVAAAVPRFDLIVCNPPFFAESLRCPNAARNAARHDDTLKPDDLFRLALAWLKPATKVVAPEQATAPEASAPEQAAAPTPTLCLILPSAREQEAALVAARYGWQTARLCRVFTTPRAAAPHRTLMAFTYAHTRPAPQATPTTQAPTPTTTSLHLSSTEYLDLVRPFYLNL